MIVKTSDPETWSGYEGDILNENLVATGCMDNLHCSFEFKGISKAFWNYDPHDYDELWNYNSFTMDIFDGG